MFVIRFKDLYISRDRKIKWCLVLELKHAHKFDTRESAILFVEEQMGINVEWSTVDIMEVFE